jgi:hypothetical protein
MACNVMQNVLRVCLLAVVLAGCSAVHAAAQQCPQTKATGTNTAPEVRTLEGSLIYHDGIRKWFELKLDQPQCGQTSIQLVQLRSDDSTLLQLFRGCRVRSTGSIDFSPTGYYSLKIYQDVEHIEPASACAQQQPLPDYSSKIRPDKSIREYRIDMQVDYEPGDHPIIFHVSSGGKELKPWQAYASYMLTGGEVLYGYCGEGFVVDKVFGTAQANPSHFDQPHTPRDAAMFEPEVAADAGQKNLRLGYTCIRQQ